MKTALVTGASRGIGRAIARALAADGWQVLGTSRNPQGIPVGERLAGVRYLPLDLRDEASIDALAAQAGEVDLLINNAGQSQIGAIEEVPLEKMRGIFDANLFGALRLVQRILPSMRGRRAGAIVTIASMAALAPVPFISTYAASKAGLVAACRALRHEVAPWGITVAVVAPFDVRTTIPLEVCYTAGSAYLPTVGRAREIRDRHLAEALGPDVVAKAVMRVIRSRRPRFFTPAGRRARLSLFLIRHLPDAVIERIVRRTRLPRG